MSQVQVALTAAKLTEAADGGDRWWFFRGFIGFYRGFTGVYWCFIGFCRVL